MCSDNHNLPKFKILMAVEELSSNEKVATPENISQQIGIDRRCVSVMLSNYYSQGYLDKIRSPPGANSRFSYRLSYSGLESLECLKDTFATSVA